MRSERKYRVLFRKALLRQGERIVRAIGQGATDPNYLAGLILEDDIRPTYNNLYFELVRYYGQGEYNRIQKKYKKQVQDIWYLSANRWIQSEGAKRVRNITEASRAYTIASLQAITTESIAQGLGAFETTRLIQKQFSEQWGNQAFYRAERIARTEVASAANYGIYEGAVSTGLPNLQKKWIASIDGRERASHREANGQIVAMDKDFSVGGTQMTYPCDPKGGASEVIACRCRMVTVTPLDPEYKQNLI